jgi:hypothetical protein
VDHNSVNSVVFNDNLLENLPKYYVAITIKSKVPETTSSKSEAFSKVAETERNSSNTELKGFLKSQPSSGDVITIANVNKLPSIPGLPLIITWIFDNYSDCYFNEDGEFVIKRRDDTTPNKTFHIRSDTIIDVDDCRTLQLARVALSHLYRKSSDKPLSWFKLQTEKVKFQSNFFKLLYKPRLFRNN